MSTYAAVVGHQPSLSLAELSATIPDFKFLKAIEPGAVLFTSEAVLGPKDLDRWGGVFLLASELKSDATLADIPKLLGAEVKDIRGKVTFSLRSFGVHRGAIHQLYRDCKKQLKSIGKPSRYIGNERQPPVAALLRDSGVIGGKHGCEIVLLAQGNRVWIGKTIAVQDPGSYTKRDMEKPVRDTRVGLLPPKLAQILLNLGLWSVAQTNPKAPRTLTIFDPFCGTGVIPMEALLRHWNALASDLSLKAVNGCVKNLDWLRKEFSILKRDTSSDVWKQDATKPFELKELPHAVVTETTLGDPLSNRPTVKDAQKIRTSCEDTEIDFLKNAALTLPGVPLVVTWPVWFLKNGPLFLERTLKALPDIGYKAILPPGIKADNAGRGSLLYHRPEQFVGREVLILKPVPPKKK